MLLYDHELRLLVAEGDALVNRDLDYEAFIGRTLAGVLSPHAWEELQDSARGALRGQRHDRDYASEDGERFYRITFGPVRDDQGAVQAGLAVAEDVTERRHTAERLSHLATHDELTGLTNRAAFHEVADDALRRTRRFGSKTALLFIDVDGLKAVNDSLGHEAGDALLRAVAERLEGAVREVDTVARFGGDEFAALLERVGTEEEAAAAAERMVRAIAEPLDLERAGGPSSRRASASRSSPLLRRPAPSSCAPPTPRCTAPRASAATATTSSTRPATSSSGPADPAAAAAARPGASRDHRTVSVPSIPPSRCPGTEQKKTYSPGARSAFVAAVAPVTVLVAARLRRPCAIVTLWGSSDSLTSRIASLPAGTCARFLSKASPPAGSAVSCSVAGAGFAAPVAARAGASPVVSSPAVATAEIIVAATSRPLTVSTRRARPADPGNPAWVIPIPARTSAHATSRPPAT